MRKALFLIAFILLANPFFSYVDILPDFIGYILIMIALSKPSFYDDKASSAYKSARNMLLVSIARFVCIYFTTLELDSTLSLLFSFSFFTMELIFGIPLMIKLYDYFSERALKTENTVALKLVDAFKVVTIVLFILRLLLSTLPDFILLTVGDPLETYHNDYSGMRPMLVVLSAIISMAVTIAWLVIESLLTCKLFNKREAEETKALFEMQVKHKELQYKLKSHKIALTIIGILSFLAFEFRLDNINVICNTILPIVFIAIYVFFLIKKYIKIDKLFYALLGTTACQLIFYFIVRAKTKAYFKQYTAESVLKVSQAETMYYKIIPLMVISSLLFVACVSLMLYLLIKNARISLQNHLPVVLPNTDFDYTLNEYTKKAKVLGIVTTALAFLSAIFSPIVFSIMPRVDELTKVKIFAFETNLSIFQAFIPVQFILTLGFVVAMISTLIVIYESTYKKLYEAISLD